MLCYAGNVAMKITNFAKLVFVVGVLVAGVVITARTGDPFGVIVSVFIVAVLAANPHGTSA